MNTPNETHGSRPYAPCCRAYVDEGWACIRMFLRGWVRSYIRPRVPGVYDSWRNVDRNGLGAAWWCLKLNIGVLIKHRCPWHEWSTWERENYLAVAGMSVYKGTR